MHFSYVCPGFSEWRPEQNSQHFADRIFKCLFWNEIFAYIDELIQERYNSSALAMEVRLSCIKPSIKNSL